MVYNEMIVNLSNANFGSPISPPDSFLECGNSREVPSPSQYSDPSSSPPSMHSPSHTNTYCSQLPSEVDKLENLLKDEPLSPYNYTANGLLMTPPHPGSAGSTVSNHQVSTSINQSSAAAGLIYQHQTGQSQQMQQQQQQYQMPQQQQYHHQQLQHQFPTPSLSNKGDFNAYSADNNCVSDYDLQQILNHPEIAKTVDCLMTQEDLLFNGNSPDTSLLFNGNSPDTSLQFQPYQQSTPSPRVTSQAVCQFGPSSTQQQQSFNQALQLPASPESLVGDQSPLMTTIGDQSPNMTISEQSLNMTTIDDQSTNMIPTESFESLIECSDIKTEDNIDCPPQLDAFFIMDTIMRNIINEAGVSQNPCDWSGNDVRIWLKKSADLWNIPLTEMSATVSIDGATLIDMTPSQFASVMGSKESETLREFLCHWISLRNEANSKIGFNSPSFDVSDQIMQVKLEAGYLESDLKQVKQEVVPHAMLPASVINHNPSQTVSSTIGILPPYKEATQMQQSLDIQSSQKSLINHRDQQHQFRNFQNQQQQISLHQQPSKDYEIQVNSVSSLSRISMGQNVQSFNQRTYSQLSVSTNQQQALTKHITPSATNQGSDSLRQINSGSLQQQSTVAVAKPASPMDTQGSVPQHNLPSPKNNPVPLLEGANGYLDDSGTDLSALLQQATTHPATLDQEDPMDTDEDDEVVPAPIPGTTSGRTHIQLWQFLKELLANNKRYGSCIRWLDRQEAIFKIEDSVKVATLWGERKNRPQMNYDKLSRSIRQYYNKNIMKKTERSQRLVYQFCSPYGQ